MKLWWLAVRYVTIVGVRRLKVKGGQSDTYSMHQHDLKQRPMRT